MLDRGSTDALVRVNARKHPARVFPDDPIVSRNLYIQTLLLDFQVRTDTAVGRHLDLTAGLLLFLDHTDILR